MAETAAVYKLTYRHDVFEGNAFEAGRWQGEQLSSDEWRGSFSGKPPFLKFYTPAEAEKALRFAEQYCPGITDEIRGAVEGSGVPIERMTFLGGCVVVDGTRHPTFYTENAPAPRQSQSRGCSHFCIPRAMTPDSHVRLGVNYDCHPEMQELRLCSTRIEGKAAHIAISDNVFGRVSGLNEHGLGVTSSLGSPLSEVRVAGLTYNVVSRILLDQCCSVPEALETLETLPIAWFSNYILADTSGETALVEIACADRAVRRLRADEARAVWATNHYTLPEMDAYASLRMRQSVKRWEYLRDHLENPSVPIESPQALLAAPFPNGLRTSHYLDGLGTLNSMILDIDSLTVDICFGSAARNARHTFGLDSPVGSTFYEVEIENVPAPKGFWAT
jgi:predicted choloylglycine hydrolase